MDYKIEPGADLAGADLVWYDLAGANLIRASLTHAILSWSNLTGADLREVDLTEADLAGACLIRADLSGANLTGADLSGANLSGANLTGTIGIGTREGEIEFAQDLLKRIEKDRDCLDMVVWHACNTTHCVAKWAFPDGQESAQPASLLYPTLARYFFTLDKEEAIAAIGRVAIGKESVWN